MPPSCRAVGLWAVSASRAKLTVTKEFAVTVPMSMTVAMPMTVPMSATGAPIVVITISAAVGDAYEAAAARVGSGRKDDSGRCKSRAGSQLVLEAPLYILERSHIAGGEGCFAGAFRASLSGCLCVSICSKKANAGRNCSCGEEDSTRKHD